MTNSFSIVIPVRVDCDERLENLRTVLTWVDRIGCQIIVLEADEVSKLQFVQAVYKHVEYIFIKDSEMIFHRTKYINVLLRHTCTSVVAVWDADIIIPIGQVSQAIATMIEGPAIIVYPYSGTFYMLSEEISLDFRKRNDLDRILSSELSPLMGRRSCGGVYFVKRVDYLSIGGENEKYKGWGPEDAERLRRVQIVGKKAEWLSYGPAFHLFHKRNISQELEHNQDLLQMRKEFVRECSMNETEMLAYIHNELLE